MWHSLPKPGIETRNLWRINITCSKLSYFGQCSVKKKALDYEQENWFIFIWTQTWHTQPYMEQEGDALSFKKKKIIIY